MNQFQLPLLSQINAKYGVTTKIENDESISVTTPVTHQCEIWSYHSIFCLFLVDPMQCSN
jgi:nitrous oxide reductase